MVIGGRNFDVENNTYVMGILNVTPDSFSDGGKWNHLDKALLHVETMISEGMDILDIGGESSRPGHTMVSEEEEIYRVVPMIEAVKKRFQIPISLDTCKSNVAKAGIEAGIDLINDIWGLKYDLDMGKIIADSNLPCCLMHNRFHQDYCVFLSDVIADLAECVDLAKKAGIQEDKIILDPGIGFAKTYENNLEIIHHLEVFSTLGYPLLLGASRKSVIGTALNQPVDSRLEGTLVTTMFAVMKGYSFVRVHDIKENINVIQMTKSILTGGN